MGWSAVALSALVLCSAWAAVAEVQVDRPRAAESAGGDEVDAGPADGAGRHAIVVDREGRTRVVSGAAAFERGGVSVPELVERFAAMGRGVAGGGEPAVVLFVERAVDAAAGPGAAPGELRPSEGRLVRLDAGLSGVVADVIELTDGRRMVGEWYRAVSASDEPAGRDVVRWRAAASPAFVTGEDLAAAGAGLGVSSEEFGAAVEVPLERVRRIMTGAAREAAMLPPLVSEEGDRLVFLNGDELTGFVVSLDPDVTIETATGERTVDRALVAAVTLANPSEAAAGATAWLESRAVVRVLEARLVGERSLVLETAAFGPVVVRPEEVVALAGAGGSFTPLAEYEVAEAGALGERAYAEPVGFVRHPADVAPLDVPPAGLMDLVMPGPMSVVLSAPAVGEGAVDGGGGVNGGVLVATVELASSAPRWADCELVVVSDGVETARVRLHAGERSVSLRAAVGDGERIELRLEEGAYGPIGDRVVLRRPMVVGR